MCHDGNFDLHLVHHTIRLSAVLDTLARRWLYLRRCLESLTSSNSSPVNVDRPSMNSSITAAVLRRVSARPASSTCTSCRGQFTKSAHSRPSISRTYGHNRKFHSSGTSKPPPSSRRTVLLCASLGAAGASVLAVGDDIKGAYEGTQRAGRVASALFICINE